MPFISRWIMEPRRDEFKRSASSLDFKRTAR
jgi:hypothetical protein